MNQFPLDCKEKHCIHFRTWDDNLFSCNLMRVSVDTLDENYSVSDCPIGNKEKESENNRLQ